MRNFLIGLLGGVSREAYDSSMKYERSCYDGLVAACEKHTNRLREEHESAKTICLEENAELRKLLDAATTRLSEVEEERANASAGWTEEVNLKETWRTNCVNTQKQLSLVGARVEKLQAELDEKDKHIAELNTLIAKESDKPKRVRKTVKV